MALGKHHLSPLWRRKFQVGFLARPAAKWKTVFYENSEIILRTFWHTQLGARGRIFRKSAISRQNVARLELNFLGSHGAEDILFRVESGPVDRPGGERAAEGWCARTWPTRQTWRSDRCWIVASREDVEVRRVEANVKRVYLRRWWLVQFSYKVDTFVVLCLVFWVAAYTVSGACLTA